MRKIITLLFTVVLVPAVLLPSGILIEDVPDDAGDALRVSWELPENTENISMYRIYRLDPGKDEFILVGNVRNPNTNSFIDRDPRFPIHHGMEVIYRVIPVDIDGKEMQEIGSSELFSAKAQMFHFGRFNAFIRS